MTKTPTLKEHPYSSHISKFALFPSFISPDDPDQGVRAASQHFPNRLIPNKAPCVTLISKAIGGPYRQEILENPTSTRKKAVTWTRELDHVEPLRREKESFYPAPSKTILPNPKLRDWDLTLSERTSNMLRNLERSLWVTSYQMHYTGSGPAHPLKREDFKDKISNLTGTNSHSASLKERSYPVFVPSKPKQGRSSGMKLQYPAPSAFFNQCDSQEIEAPYNKAAASNQMGQSQSKFRTGFTERQQVDRSLQAELKCSVHQDIETKPHKVQFLNTEQHLDLNNHPNPQTKTIPNRQISPVELKNETFKGANPPSSSESYEKLITVLSSEREGKTEGRDLLHPVANPVMLPRPPILPGIHQTGSDISLLELQRSFSKSEAQRKFNSSVTRAAVNQRDNVVSGKKHNFFGINCNYIHG